MCHLDVTPKDTRGASELKLLDYLAQVERRIQVEALTELDISS